MRHLLAVWNDCASDAEEDYESWYTEEHLLERVSIPGFVSGHRYAAQAADRRYFTYYETLSAEPLHGQDYLSRLQNPSPRTRRIMPAFTNALRTVCAVTARQGCIQGAHVVTLRREQTHAGAVAPLFARAAEASGATRTQLWTATEQQTPQTAEARLRPGNDTEIREALVVEFQRLPDAAAFADQLRREGATCGEVGVYSHLCSLHRESLPS